MALRLYKASQFVKNSNLSIERKRITAVALHAHDYFEIEIILDGVGQQRLNGTVLPLRPGSIYLLTPSDFHEILPGSDLLIWNISFTEAMIPADSLHSLCTDTNALFRQTEQSELQKLDLAAGLLREEFACNGCIRPLVEYLLVLVLRYARTEKALSPMQKAVFYIDTHFRENLSLAQVAEQACLSPVYFGNLFKQHTGMTYVQYLTFRRVICAKMLLESGCSVSETCHYAGFGSLSNFLHAFKRETGVSPREYKRNYRQI